MFSCFMFLMPFFSENWKKYRLIVCTYYRRGSALPHFVWWVVPGTSISTPLILDHQAPYYQNTLWLFFGRITTHRSCGCLLYNERRWNNFSLFSVTMKDSFQMVVLGHYIMTSNFKCRATHLVFHFCGNLTYRFHHLTDGFLKKIQYFKPPKASANCHRP